MNDGVLGGSRRGSVNGRIVGRLVPGLVIAALAFLGLAVYSDFDALRAALARFDYVYLAPALALAAANYLIRFARWCWYLRFLGVDVPLRRSAAVFFTGLSMAVTPGRVGELVKCLMLRDSDDVPVATSAPVVVVERYTDLVGVLLLTGLGVARYPAGRVLFAAGIAAAAVAFAVFQASDRLAERFGAMLARRLFKASGDGAAGWGTSFRVLLRGRPLLAGTSLAVIAWFSECVALYLVFKGFGTPFPLFSATFVYAAATLAGALSMLPGGLGATEAGLTGLAVALGAAKATASAATMIVRACTLWFAVAVGLIFYATRLGVSRRALEEAGEAGPERAEVSA